MKLLSRLFGSLRGAGADDADQRHAAGVAGLRRGNAAEGLGHLEAAVAQDPCHARWWYDLGEARRLLSQADAALEAYAKALDLDRAFIPALSAMYDTLVAHGATLLDAADFARAQDVYQRAIALAPERVPAQRGLVEAIERAVKAGLCDGHEGTTETPAELPFFSIVICSIDAAKFERVTAMYRTLLAGARYEIVGIHDARSLCEGYNRGIDRSRGDVIVFSHDDVEILEPAFAQRLAAHMARHELVGVCGTTRLTDGHWHTAGWPHLRGLVAHHYPDTGRYRVLVLDGEAVASGGVQGFDGLFFAARRSLVDTLRFDEATFDAFHLYDLDYSFAAHLAGHDVAICNDIPMIHYAYADSAGYLDAHARSLARFREKYRGRLASVEQGNTRFLQAVFDRKEDVKTFCDALLRARREAVRFRRPSPP